MDRVRIDKWLWAARFFKTRSLAAHACELGRVEHRGQATKPAHEVKAGDMILVRTPSGEFTIEILQLSDVRGPAPVAQALYRETEESKVQRAKAAEERKVNRLFESPREGRPSKRDRRRLDHLRGRG